MMNCTSPRVLNCLNKRNSSSCILGDRAFSGSSSRYSPFLCKAGFKKFHVGLTMRLYDKRPVAEILHGVRINHAPLVEDFGEMTKNF